MSLLYAAFCDLAAARDERNAAMSAYDDVDEDARAEAIDERRRRARLNHWCTECRGMRGGPCDFGEEEDEEESNDGS